MTRVLVVAASPVVRAGLEALLAGSANLTVSVASAHPDEVADAVEAGEPDVVLVDAADAVPGDGLPLRLALAPDAAPRAPAVVMLAHDPGAAWAAAALRAGARAVLPPAASAAAIVAAVEAVAAGLVVLPAHVAAALLPAPPARAERTRGDTGAPAPTPHLSPRESEVLAMLAEGLGNKIIAARLGISGHTVKTHVAAVLGKLSAGTRTEAVTIGARRGLIML